GSGRAARGMRPAGGDAGAPRRRRPTLDATAAQGRPRPEPGTAGTAGRSALRELALWLGCAAAVLCVLHLWGRAVGFGQVDQALHEYYEQRPEELRRGLVEAAKDPELARVIADVRANGAHALHGTWTTSASCGASARRWAACPPRSGRRRACRCTRPRAAASRAPWRPPWTRPARRWTSRTPSAASRPWPTRWRTATPRWRRCCWSGGRTLAPRTRRGTRRCTSPRATATAR
ncbi:unnamed protein product, partial [Prorocentrum cordatum]